mmetsp:Transcript_165718/g.532071  ORF Transcript_165718/g.532071 Transcript_165718/m.532071 type:complete len:372 (-) Transcript_165718:901-2016(-)
MTARIIIRNLRTTREAFEVPTNRPGERAIGLRTAHAQQGVIARKSEKRIKGQRPLLGLPQAIQSPLQGGPNRAAHAEIKGEPDDEGGDAEAVHEDRRLPDVVPVQHAHAVVQQEPNASDGRPARGGLGEVLEVGEIIRPSAPEVLRDAIAPPLPALHHLAELPRQAVEVLDGLADELGGAAPAAPAGLQPLEALEEGEGLQRRLGRAAVAPPETTCPFARSRLGVNEGGRRLRRGRLREQIQELEGEGGPRPHILVVQVAELVAQPVLGHVPGHAMQIFLILFELLQRKPRNCRQVADEVDPRSGDLLPLPGHNHDHGQPRQQKRRALQRLGLLVCRDVGEALQSKFERQRVALLVQEDRHQSNSLLRHDV